MPLRAQYRVTGPGPARALIVFDDGIVVGNTSPSLEAFEAFGNSLGLAGIVILMIAEAAKRQQGEHAIKKATARHIDSAATARSKLKGADLFLTADVTEIRLEKRRRNHRTIVIDETGGVDPTHFPLARKRPTDSQVDETLTAIFGYRYKNNPACEHPPM